MLNMSPVRSPASSTLVLASESWAMLKVLPLAMRCPPELTVTWPPPPVKVVPTAVSIPPTAIVCE